jgi:hypothetical protein
MPKHQGDTRLPYFDFATRGRFDKTKAAYAIARRAMPLDAIFHASVAAALGEGRWPILMRRMSAGRCELFARVDRDVRVSGPIDPAAKHAVGIERRGDVAMRVECDHAAVAAERGNHAKHDFVGRTG